MAQVDYNLLDYARDEGAEITPLIGLELYTAQMSVKCDPLWLVIDTTVKSAKPPWTTFTPTWDLVMGHKRGEISDERYTRLYYGMMRTMLEDYRSVFNRVVLSRVPVVLKCYCAAGKFCHRHLLVHIFEKMCDAQEIPFFYGGELK